MKYKGAQPCASKLLFVKRGTWNGESAGRRPGGLLVDSGADGESPPQPFLKDDVIAMDVPDDTRCCRSTITILNHDGHSH